MYCVNLSGRGGHGSYSSSGYVASLPGVLRAMRKVRIWRVFQTYKFRVGKDHYCLEQS